MNGQSPFNKTYCPMSDQLYIFESWVEAVFICVYMAIFLVGVAGNLLVIGVILGNKHMWTTINLFLLNLAASDIIMSIFASSKFLDRWRFLGEEEAMCKLTTTSMTVSVNMSTFTLATIAINRYRAVFYPFRTSTQNSSLTRTVAIILTIDLMAILITLPRTVDAEFIPNHYQQKLVCMIPWPLLPYRVYWWFIHIAQFVIPFTIIIISYVSIMIRLRQRARNQPESRTEIQIQEEDARTARVNKMLMAMVFIFGICWFPQNLIQHLSDIDKVFCWELYFLSLYIAHVIAMSSTCYNPFLYGWMNPAFKTEFAKLCSRFLNIATAKQDSHNSVNDVSEEVVIKSIGEIEDGSKRR